MTKEGPPPRGGMDERFGMVLVLIARDSTYVKKKDMNILESFL